MSPVLPVLPSSFQAGGTRAGVVPLSSALSLPPAMNDLFRVGGEGRGAFVLPQRSIGTVKRVLPCLNQGVNQDWISGKAKFSFGGLKRQQLLSSIFHLSSPSSCFSSTAVAEGAVGWKAEGAPVQTYLPIEMAEHYIAMSKTWIPHLHIGDESDIRGKAHC